jgi:hypothetical protein
MPNYRGEIKCELGPVLGEVTSEASGKFSNAWFDTKTGKILAATSVHLTGGDVAEGAKVKAEAKPLVEACRKLLAGPPK